MEGGTSELSELSELSPPAPVPDLAGLPPLPLRAPPRSMVMVMVPESFSDVAVMVVPPAADPMVTLLAPCAWEAVGKGLEPVLVGPGVYFRRPASAWLTMP